MASKIDIDRFICDLFSTEFNDDEKEKIQWKCESGSIYAPLYVAFMAIEKALKQQDLVYKNGKIVEIDKAQTIKFNEPMTNAEKRYFDKILFNDVRYKPIDFDKIDIDKMVEEFTEKIYNYLPDGDKDVEWISINVSANAKCYRQGLEDMLKLIKEGGE